MHVILTGATGLVGASVLHNMLAQESISRISILSRRPVKMAEGHEKAKVIIHKDFKTYDQALLEELKDAQGCVWAQGVSQNAVDKAYVRSYTTLLQIQTNHDRREYIEITHDYPLAAAKAFSTFHPTTPFTFLYVSGEGATQSPGMFTPLYGRVKGQIETALLEFGKRNPMFKVYNVRPGGVDWTQHPEIHPFIPKQDLYKKMFIPPMNLLYRSMMTPTREMGKVMTELAMSRGEPLQGTDIGMEGRMVSNVALRRMAGL
jgi:nucleoside-diphosphate-sugar epimerase